MIAVLAAMKSQIIMYSLQLVLNLITPENLKELVLKVREYIVTKVLGTETKTDDYLFFPIMGVCDAILSLPPDTRVDTRSLSAIMSSLMNLLSKEEAKKLMDFLLDILEDLIEKSENKWDDALIIPALRAFRTSFDIPDND